MTTRLLNNLVALVATATVLGSLVASTLAADPQAPTPRRGKVHIVLAGDSTVTNNAGWGKGFADAMSDEVEVINLAKGGRSSSSYHKEGSWKKVLDLKPDYVLIQFGHNDQPGHGDRETDPQTTYRQFMTRYVEEARAAGINPVLVTSLSRRTWGDGAKINPGLKPWADAVKAIAAEKNVPLIDLHSLSIAEYEKLGKEGVLQISPLKNADPANPSADTSGQKVDGTHLNEKGSQIFGRMVALELKKVVPNLAPHIQ